MIERKYKSEYDDSYKAIRKIIANYITLIINSPENFELNLTNKDIQIEFTNYISDTDEEELVSLLIDIYQTTKNDLNFLSSVFSILFSVIHAENINIVLQNQNNPFEKLTKNANLLISLFGNCPETIEAFVNDNNFLPKNIKNGNEFQHNTFFSMYLNGQLYDSSQQAYPSILTRYSNLIGYSNWHIR